ncbi:MAG: septum formation protein Maf [Caldilineaceae bacterium]|nr:septum formation protein Maf [Caldilineaceae bacterium]
MNPLKLILASASPRRRRFLQELDLPHRALVADIDEDPKAHEEATDLAARLALGKATAIADRLPPEDHPALIIGADTVVALNGAVLGKPMDEDEAIEMLRRLRRETHQVHSALALLFVAEDGARRQQIRMNTTDVDMRGYSNEEIVQYVASGDPLDKAGAYAIQHREFDPVASLRGCAAGVMGLPVADLCEMLAQFGVDVNVPLAPVCQRLTGLPCCQEG